MWPKNKLAKQNNKLSNAKRNANTPARGMAAILSLLSWTFGFFLAFVIAPHSTYIWLPDFLLLFGFIPLLLVWRLAWPWLVFGIFNIFIGFVLQVAQVLPDSDFPSTMTLVKHHLDEYHVPLTWILFGFVSVAYGTFRLFKSLVHWIFNRSKH